MRSFLVALGLIVVLVSSPVTGPGPAQGQEVPAGAASTPAFTPSPTPTLEPTPSPEPTLVPTAVPTMIPTVVPTSAPQPTAQPTLPPTPTPTTGRSNAPQAVTGDSVVTHPGGGSGSGQFANCLESGPDQLQPGQTLTVTCSYATKNNDVARFTVAAPTSTISGGATGWQVLFEVPGVTSTWITSATTYEIPRTTNTTLTIRLSLRSPDDAVSGIAVSSTVTSQLCKNPSTCDAGSLALSAGTAAPDGNDVSISCTPASGSFVVTRLSSGSFTCQVNALPGLGSTSLIVRSVTISAPPAGWTMTTSPTGAAGVSGAVTISPGVTLAAGQTWSFTITLAAGCGSSATADWAIATLVANTNGTVTGADVAGPGMSYSVTAVNGEQAVAASLVSSTLTWSLPFSFDNRTVSGAVAYRVTASGCSGWSVSVASGPFVYTGQEQGADLERHNMALTSMSAPSALSGESSGVTSTDGTGGLHTARQVLVAQPGSGNGTYQQDLGVTVTVPGGTPMGSYRSTITITTSASP